MVTSTILLDYQSSTPCLDKVVEAMKPYWSDVFANPSSKSNVAGIYASAVLEANREKISKLLDLQNKKIIFTSGATEANNLALLGFARNFYKNNSQLGHIITLNTEHHAVLEPIRQLKKEGFTVTEINPRKDGLLTKEKFLSVLKKDTFLVSIMLANNEIGVVQPIEEISAICASRKIILHTDAAQCLGYLPLEFSNCLANMITISSHKIYGPKGIGLLIIDKDIVLSPLFMGGGQEFGLRAGTIPLPLIIGFAKAIELALENQVINAKKLLMHRNSLLKGLLENNSGILINGSMKFRLPHNLNITISDVSGSLLHKKLKPKIICSSGSACSGGKPSHVLRAIGRTFNEAESSIRFGIGLNTNSDEIEEAVIYISNVISSLRK
tara:strand:+ start:12276 stop:13424 length:1149 start_codon:yes stop_codon:yes gene_type:complete